MLVGPKWALLLGSLLVSLVMLLTVQPARRPALAYRDPATSGSISLSLSLSLYTYI